MAEWRRRWLGLDGRTRGGSSRAVPARAVRASIAVMLLVPHLVGCYHYVPATHAAMPSGAEVSVGITDRGRVALSDQVGPGVRRVGGQVLETTDTSLVLAVTSVEYLDLSVPMQWAGEPVRLELAPHFFTEVRERRLSRSRTWMMGGLIAVVAVAVSMIAIRGIGGEGPDNRPGNGDGGQQ